MSLSSKIVFGTCCLATVSTIAYVHIKQHADRKNLREGVIKDVERQKVQQEMKKTMNMFDLQKQKDFEKVLRKQLQESENIANET